jgi:hypothetical protein
LLSAIDTSQAVKPIWGVREGGAGPPEGKKLYALRKQTPEPVFGIIKSVLGFRQFLLRGLDTVRGEWNLVTLAYNIKRLFALTGAA